MRVLLLWMSMICVTAPASRALAHSFDPALLTLRERTDAQGRGVFDVGWRLPAAQAGWSEADRAAIAPRFPARCKTIVDPQVLDCGSAGIGGARVGVNGLVGTDIDVIVRVRWRDGREFTGVLHAGAPEIVVPGSLGASAIDRAAVVGRFMRLGVGQVLNGYHHLLFVMLLLVWAGPHPAALAKVSAAFAVGHSLTLAAGAVGFADVPVVPVRALIALTSAVLAAEIARVELGRRRVTAEVRRRLQRTDSRIGGSPRVSIDVELPAHGWQPWTVAFLFGLLHGLGFAQVFRQVAVPAGRLPWALGAFNFGIEIGVVGCVVVVLALELALSRSTKPWTLARLAGVYAAGAVAMAWSFQSIAR